MVMHMHINLTNTLGNWLIDCLYAFCCFDVLLCRDMPPENQIASLRRLLMAGELDEAFDDVFDEDSDNVSFIVVGFAAFSQFFRRFKLCIILQDEET